MIRTNETRLKYYQPKGLFEAKDPPWRLQIIARSGFRSQKTQQAPVSGKGPDRDASPIDSRLDALIAAHSARTREQPAPVPVPALAPAPRAKVGPIVPTQAVVRNQSADAQDPPSSLDDRSKNAPVTPVRRSPVPPKRDTMVQRAGMAGDDQAAAATPAPSKPVGTADPQVQQARAQQQPPTRTQPPIIDLPPIEGAPRSRCRISSPSKTTARRRSSRSRARKTP